MLSKLDIFTQTNKNAKWGGGGGGVVCESSDVRKFLKNRNSKISQSSLKLKLEIIIDRDSNIRAFTYDVCSNIAHRRQQISLIKNRSLKQGSIVRGKK